MPVAQSNGTEVWELPGVQPYLQLVAEMHLSISNDGSAAPSQLRHQNRGGANNFWGRSHALIETQGWSLQDTLPPHFFIELSLISFKSKSRCFIFSSSSSSAEESILNPLSLKSSLDTNRKVIPTYSGLTYLLSASLPLSRMSLAVSRVLLF